jgi:hypothetical protein
MVNSQTGTDYTFVNADCDPQGRKLVTFTSATNVAVTLPQAGASNAFLGGCTISLQNLGLGTVTITPTTSTINGQTTLLVPSGTGATIYNNSTGAATGNYFVNTGAGQAGGLSNLNFRNVLHNGAMSVQQRGTGIRTCAQNAAITSAAYSADRWGCSANVASGAGRAKAVTTSLPDGFSGAQNIYRNSGALTQPVCSMQEILSTNIKPLADGTVTLSFYAKADAGLSADNGNVIDSYILTGTGADQGLGTMTASPAITPAWTGISAALTSAHTITTSWARYSYTASLPAGTTEAAVALCFTPTASGAGTTDGFFFTGVQLEQGAFATPFEFRPYALEQRIAQRFYYQITEPAAGISIGASGQGASTTTCPLTIKNPATMRVAPTVTFEGTTPGATTWTVTHVVTATALSTPFLAATVSGHTVDVINITATTGASLTAGQTCILTGAAGGSIIAASADF